MPSESAAWRHLARVLRGEARVDKAARAALAALLDYTQGALATGGYDPGVLSPKASGWTQIVDASLLPQIEDVFLASFNASGRGIVDPAAYAVRHLESVTNRLHGVQDDVFDVMRLELEKGRQLGEGIPQLAQRVDALLADSQRWNGRAATIARTEVIAAANAGAVGSAYATADVLGVEPGEVVKEWLATSDGRTRETHAEADGQQVLGLDATFSVGSSELDQPGDPYGDPAETINCRCTVLFHYPGDSSYPSLAASAGVASAGTDRQEQGMDGITAALDSEELNGGEHIGVLVVMLPAEDDPVQGIGPERKHASLLFYGEVDEVTQEADGNGHYGPDFRSVLESTVAGYAGITAPFSEAVTGVESLGDNGARVWMLDKDGQLAYVVGDLPQYESEVTPPPSEYPEYLPHVTIGYPDPEVPEEQDGLLVPELEEAAAAVESIRFDRIAVWWGGEETAWPLTGDQQTEEDPVETETTVHQGVLEAFARHLANAGADYDQTLASLQSIDLGDLATYAPGDTLPGPEGDPAPDPMEDVADSAAAVADDGEPFYGIIWPESVQSGDARAIAAGATTWRDLPLSLMYQDATMMGHDGAVRVGKFTSFTRDEATYSVPVIRYTGIWDTSAVALEAKRQVAERIVRGISTDGVSVTVELRGSDGRVLDPMVDDFPEDGVVIEVATAAQIGGGTICSLPAFHQAYLDNGRLEDRTEPEPGWNADGTPKDNALDDPPQGETEVGDQPQTEPATDPEPVAASAMAPAWSLTAAGMPAPEEARFFANPGLTEPTNLTVDDDGHVYGHLAVWGTCHIGIEGVCQEPPVSASNYAYYAKGVVPTDDGGRPRVGPLTMGTGHAPLSYNAQRAVEHYDNTGTRVADVAIGQDALGIWFSGKLCPGVTPEQVYTMRAAGAVSGDWREVVRYSGDLELVAALVVNVPGFPIPATSIAASGSQATALVASGVVKPTSPVDAGSDLLLTMADVQAAVRTVLAVRERATAAASRLHAHRVTRATSAHQRMAALAAYQRKTRATAAAARITTARED